MKNVENAVNTQSFWQLVFSQSKVNGAPYSGEQLTSRIWDWPKDTYLQRRMRESKSYQIGSYPAVNRADLN